MNIKIHYKVNKKKKNFFLNAQKNCVEWGKFVKLQRDFIDFGRKTYTPETIRS